MGRPKKGVIVPPKPPQAGMTRSEALTVFNFRRQHPLFREGNPCIPWFVPTKPGSDSDEVRDIQFADDKIELFTALSIIASDAYQEFLKPCKKGPPPENRSPK
jgi:hypothetical protein